MSLLILQGDNLGLPVSLLSEPTLAVKLVDTGTNGFGLNFLDLSGTTSLSILAKGSAGGHDFISQLAETTNNPTTVTIKGSEFFTLGVASGTSNFGDGVVTDIGATATSPTTIQSSLALIDASATTGGVVILAGATNASGAGTFADGSNINANITITYTGLTIKGGSGGDFIENDAVNGIVIDGNGVHDIILLGGAHAQAILGSGTNDLVDVGVSFLGTVETAGSSLGDKVTFGAAPTAALFIGTGAEAGLTAGTTSIGLTKVVNAAAGMVIVFNTVTSSSNIVNENAHVVSAPNLSTAENDAVDAMAAPGVAFFNFNGSEYFVATNHTEAAVSSGDAIVKLIGVIDLNATNVGGFVTMHA